MHREKWEEEELSARFPLQLFPLEVAFLQRGCQRTVPILSTEQQLCTQSRGSTLIPPPVLQHLEKETLPRDDSTSAAQP